MDTLASLITLVNLPQLSETVSRVVMIALEPVMTESEGYSRKHFHRGDLIEGALSNHGIDTIAEGLDCHVNILFSVSY